LYYFRSAEASACGTRVTAESFEWDQGNEDKLAERKIYPVDVEAVWSGDPTYSRNKRRRTAMWLMTGVDGLGRRLQIGILRADEDKGLLRAITGWRVRP